MKLRVGLLINPIAGLGGEAGFKGSDVDWQKALDAGFEPHATKRAQRFADAVDADVLWLTGPGALGLDGMPRLDGAAKLLGDTTPDDTRGAAQAMVGKVDLLCFVGGDGTATDVAAAVGERVPCLGIPGGVKITSPVFAHDPDEAAWLVSSLVPGFDTVARDVTDLDEAAYRAGRINVRLTGSLRVPLSPAVQGGKVATTHDTPLEPLVEQVLHEWDRDGAYLVGAGSVCMAVKRQFWGKPTLLGVDAIVGDRIVATDLDGPQVEAFVQEQQEATKKVRIVLSTIGGQGILLGRGTQILTAAALRRVTWDSIHVVAPPEKLVGLPGLHIDSGDPAFDAMAPKYIRVTSGYNETRMVRVLHGAAEQPR